jgi:hypothetical protein
MRIEIRGELLEGVLLGLQGRANSLQVRHGSLHESKLIGHATEFRHVSKD